LRHPAWQAQQVAARGDKPALYLGESEHRPLGSDDEGAGERWAEQLTGDCHRKVPRCGNTDDPDRNIPHQHPLGILGGGRGSRDNLTAVPQRFSAAILRSWAAYSTSSTASE
jgi:hypothetical protein